MIRDSDKESGKDIKWAKAKNGTVGSINTIVDAEIAKLPRRFRLAPAESTPPLLFNQIYELAPMYALFIVESIPGLEECASLSLNYSTASWTINEPESLIADTNDFKNITNWKQFLSKVKSNWYTKLEQPCLVEADTRSVLTQMLRLCGYLVHSRIPMVFMIYCSP